MNSSAVLVSGSKILISLFSIILNITLTRNLVSSEYGAFSYWLTCLNFLGLVCILGINISHIYFFKHKVDNSLTIISYFFYFSFTALLFQVALTWLGMTNNVFWVVPAALAMGGMSIINADAQVRLKFGEYAVQSICLAFVVMGGGVLTVLLLDVGAAEQLIITYATLTVVVFSFFAFVKGKVSFAPIPKLLESKNFFKYGLKGFLLNLLGQALYFIDIIIIGVILSDKDVAYYAVAGIVAKTLWLFIDAVGAVLFPRIILGNINEKLKKTQSATVTSFILCLLPAVTFIFIGDYALIYVFGDEYINSLESSYILVLASFPLILYKIYSRLLASENRWGIAYKALGVAVVLNVVLNLVLVDVIGIMGAAIASLISYSFCGFYVYVQVKAISINEE